MAIPVYIMEEHHEAFYYWNFFIKKGYIPKNGNYLLHVDHHDDMECGGYEYDFSRLLEEQDLDNIKEFTYSKLGIADFIIPAVYQGIFTDVHILKNLLPCRIEEKRRFVRAAYSGTGLETGSMIPFIHGSYVGAPDSPYRFYRWRNGGLGEMDLPDEPLVLDVDLDYFAWDDSLSGVPPKRMEITREAYREYRENPYHPFRILPRLLLEMVEEDGRYYMEYREKFQPDKLPEKERMIKRMDRLLGWLTDRNIRPAVIDICRSRYSGYLPSKVFPWVEETFLQKLEACMDIERMDINSGNGKAADAAE